MNIYTLVLYLTLTLLLAFTTFVGQLYGTEWVEKHIYHTSWFCILWGLLVIFSVRTIVRKRFMHRIPMLMLHASFILILAGALTTFLFGKKGYLHLREGAPMNSYVCEDNNRVVQLPFTLRLDSFRVAYYPGTEAPSDYISYVSLECCPQIISMNNILKHQGYRFYQSSFDEDKRGSWLSVNYDPWGIPITYAGYLLFALSVSAILLSPKSQFRKLLQHPLLKKGNMYVLLFSLFALPLNLKANSLTILNNKQVDSLSHVQVIYQDRVAPLNTLARDFVKKLFGKDEYKGLSAEQVLGGWLLYPNEWKEEPIIQIKGEELRTLLGLKGEYASLSDLFEGENYRLQQYWKPQADAVGELSQLEKNILETDEKVGLILMLQNGTLIRPLPEGVQPLTSTKVYVELLYNKLPFVKVMFVMFLSLGILSFALLIYRNMQSKRVFLWSDHFFSLSLYASTILLLLIYLMRWYIAARIPLSNGFETMLFMALIMLILASCLHRKFPFILSFAFLLAGFSLLVAYLGQMNPQITPLMPVLVSPWLSFHVSFIMISYALFAFMMLCGILGLLLPHHAAMLQVFSKMLLYPSTFFLGVGIFMGAVWANVSWGRYWAWDPKEVWALITFMIYGIAFHEQSLLFFKKPRFYHIYMVVAFFSVLMTYFGVNYILGGLHSYANN